MKVINTNIGETKMIGINVCVDGDVDYADLIISGTKTFESRKSNTLKPYIGKTVAIVRTGKGKAKAIGTVTIGEPLVVGAGWFRKLQPWHLVAAGSKFDIEDGGTKVLYPLYNATRFDVEKDVGLGIIARKVLV